MPIARQQFLNMHQWSTWGAVFSTLSVWLLHDATAEELLQAVFSMRSMPRYYKQDKSRI
jgi:hypothetical protein